MMFFIVYTFFFLSNFIQGSILNTRKVIITFSIAVFFFFIIGVLYNAPYGEVTQVGSQISEEQLFKDIKLITNDKLRVISIEVWKNGEHPNVTVKTNGEINRNSKIVIVRAQIKEVKDNLSQPFEIQEAIRILLYLKDRTLPYQVDGVYVSVSNKWVISSQPQVLISKAEFDELYNNNNVINLDSQQIVKKLSEIRIAQNGEK
jgi:archaellum component FlaF (FlaF/FlaG flagellin family)